MKNTVNFTLYIPDGRNAILHNAPYIESSVKSSQGKECYTVYINYLKEAFDTNEFLLCKETLELYAVVNGLPMEKNLFMHTKPIELDQLHDFLIEVVRKKHSNLKDKPLWILRTVQTSWKAEQMHTAT